MDLGKGFRKMRAVERPTLSHCEPKGDYDDNVIVGKILP
jgi:hypothetical protein